MDYNGYPISEPSSHLLPRDSTIGGGTQQPFSEGEAMTAVQLETVMNAEKLAKYTQEELGLIMSDPSKLSSLIATGKAEFIKGRSMSVSDNFTAVLTRFDRLTEFLKIWEEQQHKGDERDFSEYMVATREAMDTESDHASTQSNLEFLMIYDAYSLAFGSEFYCLMPLATRSAQIVAEERLG